MSNDEHEPVAATHADEQRDHNDQVFHHGSRDHVLSTDPIVSYLVRWRLKEALRRLRAAVGPTEGLRTLVVCAGEGLEGTLLCDAGLDDVTVSDISAAGVRAALERDDRLQGIVLDAESADVPDDSYELVVVQDGLHHLREPVKGFTEMLRIASRAVVVLEPHDSVVGHVLGRRWEIRGSSRTFVFRWSRALVDQVTASYLVSDDFDDRSFAFWHHNVWLDRLGRRAGGGERGRRAVEATESLLDRVAGRWGNQFCGLVVFTDPE